jgi:diaminopimelate decarboxylase
MTGTIDKKQEDYEKPVMVKMQNGKTNKYGSSPSYARRVRSDIDGVPVSQLTADYGSPLFVFSETRLRRRYRDIYSAFSSRYPDVTFGWSYKTNYLPAVCAVLHQEGAVAEVVSEMEYHKARSLGIPGDRIIFNGPHKHREILRQAVQEGAKINIDHFDELYELETLAEEAGRPLNVGLRLNLDSGIFPQWFKFGFNLESGQAMDAVRRLAESGKLRLHGLHCHIGTYILDPGAYGRQVEKMVRFAYEVEEAFGFKIEYLDIGGGFPSQSRLKGSYHAPDLTVPGLDEYAEAVTSALYRELRPGHFPKLLLETGRAMIDDSGFLVSTIIAGKRLPDGRKAYIADAGINLLYTSFWYTYNMEFDRPPRGPDEPSVVYGPMCMNIDVIKESAMLPALDNGAHMILSPVGAYNVTQWLQFIEYRPNEWN